MRLWTRARTSRLRNRAACHLAFRQPICPSAPPRWNAPRCVNSPKHGSVAPYGAGETGGWVGRVAPIPRLSGHRRGLYSAAPYGAEPAPGVSTFPRQGGKSDAPRPPRTRRKAPASRCRPASSSLLFSRTRRTALSAVRRMRHLRTLRVHSLGAVSEESTRSVGGYVTPRSGATRREERKEDGSGSFREAHREAGASRREEMAGGRRSVRRIVPTSAVRRIGTSLKKGVAPCPSH